MRSMGFQAETKGIMGGLGLLALVVEPSVYWKGYPHMGSLSLSESCFLFDVSYTAVEMIK